MSSFRDTFTKEQTKENLLGYDDSAFNFFAGAVLLSILIPWTISFISSRVSSCRKNGLASEDDKNQKICGCSFCVKKQTSNVKSMQKRIFHGWKFYSQFVGLTSLWAMFIKVVLLCARIQDLTSFDPYEILEITIGATDKDIRKAYRTMSLRYHPDRNINDPSAGARFVLITKAYQALTDEIAKANYEKYGNPDGPGVMKVGIGLPHVLVDEKNQLFILLLFSVIILIIIPFIFIMYYRHTKKYAKNGVQLETLQILSKYINGDTKIRNAPELLAASAESRCLVVRPQDNYEMNPIIREVEQVKQQNFNQPIIVRNKFLILAHMQRLHHLISLSLKADLELLLKNSPAIVSSMIELAFYEHFTQVATAMIAFQRSLVQCVGFRDFSLYQVPHVDAELLKKCSKHKCAVKDLKGLCHLSKEQRADWLKLDANQIRDIDEFCKQIPILHVEAKLFVDDEKEIVYGDTCTVSIEITRTNLEKHEISGPVHAPMYPFKKYEEWWFYIVDKKSNRLLTYAKSTNLQRQFVEKVQFPAGNVGRCIAQLHYCCDSYLGLDGMIELSYEVFTTKQVKREVYLHPEDEALDNAPSLLQQMLGDVGDKEEGDED